MIRQKLQIHNLQTARSYIERNANYSLNVGNNFMLIIPPIHFGIEAMCQNWHFHIMFGRLGQIIIHQLKGGV